MSSVGATPHAAVSVSHARAEASRRNGAKSRGPRTAEGKARSAQNALKHGLRAEKHVVLPDEDNSEFAALAAAFEEELAPAGVLQHFLARRVACAAWRLIRAERLEVELFAERRYADGSAGLALIRDGNCSRSFETLLRYRGAAQAELGRALRELKALQTEPSGPLKLPAPAALRSQGQRWRPANPASRSSDLSSSQPGPEGPNEPGRRDVRCEPSPRSNLAAPERRGNDEASACLDPDGSERGRTPHQAPSPKTRTNPNPAEIGARWTDRARLPETEERAMSRLPGS